MSHDNFRLRLVNLEEDTSFNSVYSFYFNNNIYNLHNERVITDYLTTDFMQYIVAYVKCLALNHYEKQKSNNPPYCHPTERFNAIASTYY